MRNVLRARMRAKSISRGFYKSRSLAPDLGKDLACARTRGRGGRRMDGHTGMGEIKMGHGIYGMHGDRMMEHPLAVGVLKERKE